MASFISASSATKNSTLFRIPIGEKTHVRFLIFFNHADREQYDQICIERRPKAEEGIYYATYTADVPNDMMAKQKSVRSLIECHGIKDTVGYIQDTMELLSIDTEHFKSVDIMSPIYPTITIPVSKFLEKRQLILRILEDSLVSETYSLQ